MGRHFAGVFVLRTTAALLLIGPVVLTAHSFAVAQVCPLSNEKHGNLNGKKSYRVNLNSLTMLWGWEEGNITAQEGLTAVVMGADKWNEQGNAATFTFIGDTTVEELPDYWDDREGAGTGCNSRNLTYSLVVAKNEYKPYKAITFAKCKTGVWPNEVGTQFQISVFRFELATSNFWNYSVGPLENPGSGTPQWDLVQTLTHEFGHTMRLNHPQDPPATEFGVMTPTQADSVKQRNLYSYDLSCLHQIAGRRYLNAYYHAFNSGSFSTPTVFLTNVTKISAGVTKYPSWWEWSTAQNQTSMTSWAHSFGLDLRQLAIYALMGIGPTDALFREDVSHQVVLYGSYEETPQWQASGRHYANYVQSTDHFNNQDGGSLVSCNSHSGWETCYPGNFSPISTGKALAVAWDNHVNRTVVAWAHQDRQAYNYDGAIAISYGVYFNPVAVMQPSYLWDVHTTIPPAVACNHTASAWDCLLAYVDRTDTLNNLRIRRFYATAGSGRYVPVFDSSNYSVGVRTASPVALWGSGTAWYVAVRGLDTPTWPQAVKGYVSSDGGVNWSPITIPGLIPGVPWGSETGPSVVSYWQSSDNILVTDM